MDVTESYRASEAPVGGLPQLKVPRRLRRAFDRLNRPAGPPRQLVAFAVSLVLFAGGFALGRMGAVPADAPVIRSQVAAVRPIPVPGFVEYVARTAGVGPGELTLVRHNLKGGTLEVRSRIPAPLRLGTAEEDGIRLASLGRSVAVVVAVDGRASSVAAFPAQRPPLSWLEGAGAAWETTDVLLLLDATGVVRRWSFVGGANVETLPGTWTAIHQTSKGAVLEGRDASGRHLAVSETTRVRRSLDLPADARVAAVAGDGATALVETEDARQIVAPSGRTDLRLEAGFEIFGASFSPEGDRVATVLRERGRSDTSSQVMLAVFDDTGERTKLTKVGTWGRGQACMVVPAWQGSGRSARWLLATVGRGSVRAVELGGARDATVASRIAGCGLAWFE